MSGNVNELMRLVQNMSAEEQRETVEQILSMLQGQSGTERHHSGHCVELIPELTGGKPDCPHCKARASLGHIVKRGYKSGKQRFWCKACGKVFTMTTNTVFSGTHKDADVWRKFITYTIEGKSLAFCAENCEIAYQTAFTWRHKVLNAFRVNQEGTHMTGQVEMDEMLIPISYKGNRVKGSVGESRLLKPGEDNGLPRESYRRGTDNKAISSKTKACVACFVEDGNKAFYAVVPCRGFVTEKVLDETLGKHVDKEKATILADRCYLTNRYLLENGYNFTALASNTTGRSSNHKPEVKGEHRELHLQHVNAMHRHIRRFLRGYCGVSTKYLENYISLYVWLRANGSLSQKKTQKISVARAATADCYVTGKVLAARPAVPQCA